MAVVDGEPEPARPDRVPIDAVADVLRVALAHAGRVGRLGHFAEGDPAELLTRVELLDLALQRARELDPGRLEDPDLDLLRVGLRLAHVHAGCQRLRLQHVTGHRGR